MLAFVEKIKQFFDTGRRELRRLEPLVDAVNEREEAMQALSDEQLAAKTVEFRQKLSQGASLDDIKVEAFAAVREAARRCLDMRPYDVQVLGGLVLHEGDIAEMKTGEGKTLVATMPAYLNALAGEGVHVITVNDYLAKRDAEWMGEVYRFMGLDVGVIVSGLNNDQRREAYQADITYGTNNEFGFDYLRDNMALHKDQRVQRRHHYAILDEVDSILIDEARTPLIISGQPSESTDLYYQFAQVARRLKRDRDYEVDEKAKTVTPTEDGIRRVETQIGVKNLYANQNLDLSHFLNQALKAKELMIREQDYIVKDGQVIIVDQFTGRLMPGRRYSNGLHQAIEAKENVKIQQETQTLASITYQNFFRMYDKLSGMTGTAKTEEEEFRKIYGLNVAVIPTNKPLVRESLPDLVYVTEEAKFRGIVTSIERRHEKGQPVLVGTVSIEKSERLSRMLKKRGIPHQVLNAKYHEKEANIVAEAGQLNSVTIATNMAGRGTDIVLGDGVKERGGLHVLGSERHESRRIDNQLRGRAGRQGDPGSSQFFVSLEDELMRLFGSERIQGMVENMGMDDDEPLEMGLLTQAIENAQKKVESRNFEIRKNVLKYDDVLNEQRRVIYEQRNQVLEGESLKEQIFDMFEDVFGSVIESFTEPVQDPEAWDLEGLVTHIEGQFLSPGMLSTGELAGGTREDLLEVIIEKAKTVYEAKEKDIGSEQMRELERVILLSIVDRQWMQHLSAMDDVREGIGLRAYGQEEPLVAYQREAFEMFQTLTHNIRHDTVRNLLKVEVVAEPERQKVAASQEARQDRVPVLARERAVGAVAEAVGRTPPGAAQGGGEQTAKKPEPIVKGEKIGRNDPCPCGSGKKYKRCCGR